MARDPLEGIRPPDMPPRPGITPGGTGNRDYRITNAPVWVFLFILLVGIAAGFIAYFGTQPTAPTGGAQVDTPAPAATLAPPTPALSPPAPSPIPTPPADAPATHG